jgi:hypothetical protein
MAPTRHNHHDDGFLSPFFLPGIPCTNTSTDRTSMMMMMMMMQQTWRKASPTTDTPPSICKIAVFICQCVCALMAGRHGRILLVCVCKISLQCRSCPFNKSVVTGPFLPTAKKAQLRLESKSIATTTTNTDSLPPPCFFLPPRFAKNKKRRLRSNFDWGRKIHHHHQGKTSKQTNQPSLHQWTDGLSYRVRISHLAALVCHPATTTFLGTDHVVAVNGFFVVVVVVVELRVRRATFFFPLSTRLLGPKVQTAK